MKKPGLVVAMLMLVVLIALVWATRTPSSDEGAAPVAEPAGTSSTPDSGTSPKTATAPTTATPALPLLPNLPKTSNPDQYASAVAAVVFGQDTRFIDPEDYRALLMSEADPQMSSRGRSDLERMVADRTPAPDLWERMRANEQWSSWQTEDVWQPGAWDEVVTSGQAEPGWAIRNVLGQQTTHFHDGAQDRETSRERTITIGMRCPAPGAQVDRCRLALVGIGVVS